jgi:hypothetical protein
MTAKTEYIRSYAKNLPHKPEVKPSDWDSVHENLLGLLDFAVDFATDHDLPILITSIIRPKIKGVSKSKTHEEGRAFDLSVRGWTKELIKKLVNQLNEKFKTGAISSTDLKEREVVYEDGVTAGTAPHLHFQVRK